MVKKNKNGPTTTKQSHPLRLSSQLESGVLSSPNLHFKLQKAVTQPNSNQQITTGGITIPAVSQNYWQAFARASVDKRLFL